MPTAAAQPTARTNVLTEVHAFAPATVANVACGFDVFGFAIDGLGDEVIVRKREEQGINLTIQGDGGVLPTVPYKNTVSLAILDLMREHPVDFGLDITLKKNMPLGSGLGSSGASAAAALLAYNTLIGEPFTRLELLPYAMKCEEMVSGVPHADNVGPSLLGGFLLIRSYDPLDVIQVPVAVDFWCAVVHPDVEIITKDARSVLSDYVTLKDSIVQWGNTAGLMLGLVSGDWRLIEDSMHDQVVEPQRSILIPGFDAIKQAALGAGALGSSISGSGPAVFAVCRDMKTAQQAAAAMESACQQQKIDSQSYVSQLNKQGATVLSTQ